MGKKLFLIPVFFIVFLLLPFNFFLLKRPYGVSEKIEWGLVFSKFHSIEMGLDWEEAYLAIVDDLKPKSLRLPLYWQDIEQSRGVYNFADYDWMINEASKRNIKITLVVGRKIPRWPECHLPDWALSLDEEEQKKEILAFISEAVGRYKKVNSLYAWQVENEPFLSFGECPKLDAEFLDKEIETARFIDPDHPIIITDSGELSVWLRAAKRADIFGTTMYRVVWNKYLGYVEYPLPPKFFWIKANLVRLFYPDKPIIVSELQAEPWGPEHSYEMTLEEQFKSMSIERFKDNMNYARQVGFPEVYLWGAEWWYWLKTKHGDARFWNEAKSMLE